MALKIGQLSKLTDMSVETIRFYEKENLISPQRTRGNSYRTYDVWDVFQLNECNIYRKMGFPLKEVKQMIQSDDLDAIDRRIVEQYRKIESGIEYQHMLARYLAAVHEKISSAAYNIGNYWIKRDDERYFLPYCTRENQTYTDVDYGNETLKQWLQAAPFYTARLHASIADIVDNRNEDMWSIVIEKDYFDFLRLPLTDEVHVLPSELCLHTIIDMGEKGNLQSSQLQDALAYLDGHGLTAKGNVFGDILVKWHEGKIWHRYLEIKIPVKRA